MHNSIEVLQTNGSRPRICKMPKMSPHGPPCMFKLIIRDADNSFSHLGASYHTLHSTLQIYRCMTKLDLLLFHTFLHLAHLLLHSKHLCALIRILCLQPLRL